MKDTLKKPISFISFVLGFLLLGVLLAIACIHLLGNPFKPSKEDIAIAENAIDSTLEIPPVVASPLPETFKKESAIESKKMKTEETSAPRKSSNKKTSPKSSGNILVITGSFGDAANALNEVQYLKKIGFLTAFSFPSNNKSLISVSAGSFSEFEARIASEKLKKLGKQVIVRSK